MRGGRTKIPRIYIAAAFRRSPAISRVISCRPCRDIGSRASVSLTEHFVPSLAGPRKLLASLDCKQLTQVHGVADLLVQGGQ